MKEGERNHPQSVVSFHLNHLYGDFRDCWFIVLVLGYADELLRTVLETFLALDVVVKDSEPRKIRSERRDVQMKKYSFEEVNKFRLLESSVNISCNSSVTSRAASSNLLVWGVSEIDEKALQIHERKIIKRRSVRRG